MTSATYMAGTLVTSTATFTDDDGDAADPSTITFKYQLAPGTIVTRVYPTDITKLSTGVYQSEVDTTGAPAGTATVVWEGTGTVQVPGADTWTIEPSPL